MGNGRKGLRAIGEMFGNQAHRYSLARLIARHRFREEGPDGLGEIVRRGNAPAFEFRLLVLNTDFMHVERVPFDMLVRYGGAGFASAVRSTLIDMFCSDPPWYTWFANLFPATQTTGAGYRDKVTTEVDGKLFARIESPDPEADHPSPYTLQIDKTVSLAKHLADDGYGYALLCEVWHKDQFRRLIRGGPWLLPGDSPLQATEAPVIFPYHAWKTGAGLLAAQLAETCPLVHADFREFAARGDGAMDSDFYIGKGVQLTRLGTPFGEIDFYQTHLHYGGDMTEVFAAAGEYSEAFKQAITAQGVTLRDPTAEERRQVRKAQLAEITRFIGDTRDPRRVVVVAGDFNIDGLTDESGNPVPCAPDSEYRLFDDLKEFGANLKLDDIAIRTGAGNRHTCGSTLRIDYLFIETPTKDHPFVVDVPEMAVTDLSYETTDQAPEGELSGHKALTLALRCVPQ